MLPSRVGRGCTTPYKEISNPRDRCVVSTGDLIETRMIGKTQMDIRITPLMDGVYHITLSRASYQVVNCWGCAVLGLDLSYFKDASAKT